MINDKQVNLVKKDYILDYCSEFQFCIYIL